METAYPQKSRAVFFFDIDNRQGNLETHGQPHPRLHGQHNVDPLEFTSKVDGALPLDKVLFPDPVLRELLQSLEKNKVKLWLFTNAYVNHGKRVVKLLGIEDQFEGITFCDYGAISQGDKMVCKPAPEMFCKAERDVMCAQDTPIYFVDDSGQNCSAAEKRGWITVQKLEPDEELEGRVMTRPSIRSFEELRNVFPHLFKEQSRKSCGGAGLGLFRSGPASDLSQEV